MQREKGFHREEMGGAYLRDIRHLKETIEQALARTAPACRPAYTPAAAALYGAWAGFSAGELCDLRKADIVPGGLLREGQLCPLPEFAMEPLRRCGEGESRPPSAFLFSTETAPRADEAWLTGQVSRLHALGGEDSPLTLPAVYQSGLFHRLYIAEWVDRTLDIEEGDATTLSTALREDLSDPEKRMTRLAQYGQYRRLFRQETAAVSPRLRVQTFGNFGVFWDGMPVRFHRSRTRELFAYLIDRRGAGCTMGELLSVLWEGRPDTAGVRSQLRSLIADLRTTLEELGEGAVVVKQRDLIAVDPRQVDCDYYRYLAGERRAADAFRGEYMTNYSWAEPTLGALMQKK